MEPGMATGTMVGRLTPWIFKRKNFSHRRTNFPSRAMPSVQQRLKELDPYKMVTIGMGYS